MNFDFKRSLLAATVAWGERRGIAIKHDLTDEEREQAHESLDRAEECLFPADPMEAAAIRHEYDGEEAENLRAAGLEREE